MSKRESEYSYYSNELHKVFNTVEELKEAEEKYHAENEAKLVAKEERKAEADNIKSLVKARIETTRDVRKEKAEAYRAYLAKCDELDAKLLEAEKKEKEALTAFCQKHPEGFHDTITIGDVTYNYDYTTNTHRYVDPFLKLLEWF